MEGDAVEVGGLVGVVGEAGPEEVVYGIVAERGVVEGIAGDEGEEVGNEGVEGFGGTEVFTVVELECEGGEGEGVGGLVVAVASEVGVIAGGEESEQESAKDVFGVAKFEGAGELVGEFVGEFGEGGEGLEGEVKVA